MPIYVYRCKVCGEVQDKFFSMKDKPQEFDQDCPSCKTNTTWESIVTSPMIVSGVGGFKVPEDFKSRLKDIQKHYPNMKSSVVG